MLTVACVLKSGGVYNADWVAKLRAGFAKHLTIAHRFVCLSDVDVPCERIPLRHDWPGWFSKIEVLRLQGPVLYLDLDTAIVGSLDDLAHAATTMRFAMLRDFYRGNGLGSGVMAWNDDVGSLYERFLIAPHAWINRCTGGDQHFLELATNGEGVERLQDVLPGQIVSYKIHCRFGIPKDARIVCLHGAPKFPDMTANDPVRIAWG